MINKRKPKRTLENIGIRWHNFDFQLEKDIYCYLCCNRMKKRALKKLNDELKFVSYLQWKQYVYRKYENCNKDELIEFSRYLNQRIRNKKPYREFIVILLSAIVSFLVTKTVDAFYSLNSRLSNTVSETIVVVFAVIPLTFFLIQIFTPILEDNIEENFLKDYKEIIDEIMSEKVRKCNSEEELNENSIEI